MTVGQARMWLVFAALAITGFALVFFLVAPVAGYPMLYSDAFRELQILLPVFIGYLSAATHFVISGSFKQPSIQAPPLFPILVRGPLVIFVVAFLSLLWAFGYANRPSAPAGQVGMGVDELSLGVSLILSLLSATTALLIGHLFASKQNQSVQ